jgi:hypothetical protein
MRSVSVGVLEAPDEAEVVVRRVSVERIGAGGIRVFGGGVVADL